MAALFKKKLPVLKKYMYIIAPMILISLLIPLSRTYDTFKSMNFFKSTRTTPVAPNGYYVNGNTIYNSNNLPYIFRGVNRPSLEWTPEGEELSMKDFKNIKSWNANIVRLPLNQQFWRQDKNEYRKRVQQAVSWIRATGMDVILVLHWSDKGTNEKAELQKMPDTNSLLFWKDIANLYKNDGRVLFELYNEPHDISCDVWKNGGIVDGWKAVGMQRLYDTVRNEGANNLILIGGVNWAFDLQCVKTNRIEGFNIVYATHPYNYDGKNTIADWNTYVGFLTSTDPVMMTEFGDTQNDAPQGSDCDPSFSKNVLEWAEQNQISWTAWAWYPGTCAFPPLIKDWNGTPNETGKVIQEYLRKNSN